MILKQYSWFFKNKFVYINDSQLYRKNIENVKIMI